MDKFNCKLNDSNSKEEKVIYRAKPIMADYYLGESGAVEFLAMIAKLSILFLVGLFAYLFLQSAWNNGLQYTISSTIEVIKEMPWNGWLAFGVAGFLFVVLFLTIPVLCRYYQETETIFTDKCIHIHGMLRKEKIIAYEEVETCIKSKKIRIENGGFVIPCKETTIKIPLLYVEFPQELFAFWEQRFGIRLPAEDIRSRALRTGAGWAVGHLMGGIFLPVCALIYLAGFLMDGPLTWKYAIYYIFYQNECLKGIVVLIAVGVLLNVWFVPQAVWVYKEYREVIRVSFKTIVTDLLIIGMFAGGYRYCEYINLGLVKEESQAEISATQVTERGFGEAFCRGVWLKEGDLATEQELERVKYLSVNFAGNGRVSVRYSMVDYESCEREEEFEESIQVWQCSEDEYITLPLDLSGFTGLTYLDLPEDVALKELILPKDSYISRVRIYESPQRLLELVNPEAIEILEVSCYDEENAFDCLKQCVNLRILKYENSGYTEEIDLQKLAHPEKLEGLDLKCGVEYRHLEVLQGAFGMKSLYLDTATLEQCDFVTGMSELRELGIIIDKPEDLEKIAEFKEQLSVLHLDIQEWNVAEQGEVCNDTCDLSVLADISQLQELKINFGADWKVVGTEGVLALPRLKRLTLGAGVMVDVSLLIDETKLERNDVVEELFLGGCVPCGTVSGQPCTEEYLSQFTALKKLSLTDMDSSQAPASYEFLSRCENLQSLYLWQVSLTEDQRMYLERLKNEIEVSCW